MKTKLFTLALAALTIGLLGSCKKEDPKVSVTGVTLDRTTLEITVSDPDVKLVATIAPENATDKTVSWSSGNEAVAAVDQEGNVHAVAAGTATITVTTTDGGKTATCAVTVKAALPDGALPGEFTVNAEGKKVHFSQGNLYYDGNKFNFETNQYDVQNSWSTSHVSHFTWSSTVEAAVGNTNSGNNLFCDVNNKVSVDGGEAIYYALSKDEWVYLINKKNDETIRKDKFKYGVTVCEKANCLILAPDDFEGTIAASYDNAAWTTAEAAGLVCLPAAGSRGGSEVGSVGDYGFYWSSTDRGSGIAYRVTFESSYVGPDDFGYYERGYSVRLITESK